MGGPRKQKAQTPGSESLAVSLGETIRAVRASRNTSRRDFAAKANLSYSYVSQLENGEKWPSPSTLGDVSAALGTDSFSLLAGAALTDTAKSPGQPAPVMMNMLNAALPAQAQTARPTWLAEQSSLHAMSVSAPRGATSTAKRYGASAGSVDSTSGAASAETVAENLVDLSELRNQLDALPADARAALINEYSRRP